jgi:predicted deacylase
MTEVDDADDAPREAIRIGGAEVPPGARVDLRLSVSESYIGDRLSVPMTVVNGDRPGPRMFVTAAVHGDELNGIGIVKELLGTLEPTDVAGTVVLVPVVNVLGLPLHSRYLPDRRDLNRCFPGSTDGSMASRLAHAIISEVVEPCDLGVDLHTGASGRANLPQIRAVLDDPTALEYARAFAAPILIDAPQRPGSLRAVAHSMGIPVLTYEAGEALRFDESAIGVGVAGIKRLLAHLGMLDNGQAPEAADLTALEADETHWIRADRGGIIRLEVGLGDTVAVGQPLWTVSSPFGRDRNPKESLYEGIVIGMSTVPLVNPGDAVLHIAVPGGEGDFDEAMDLDVESFW